MFQVSVVGPHEIIQRDASLVEVVPQVFYPQKELRLGPGQRREGRNGDRVGVRSEPTGVAVGREVVRL